MNIIKGITLAIALVATVTLIGLALCAFVGVSFWAAPVVGTAFMATLIAVGSNC